MNGVVNVYKEEGATSFKAVAALRSIFGVRKVGHLGTLDPLAAGVLPICVGYATRFADYLSATEKEYIAELKLGIRTDSFDITGEVIANGQDTIPSIEKIRTELSGYIGKIELTVPSFSAKKIDGVRAYKLAREGAIKDAGKSVMNILSIELLTYEYPLAVIKVVCGKGTYIRSIIDSLGERLSTFAVMTKLERTRNGAFKADEAFTIDELRKLKDNEELEKAVIPVTELLQDWGRAVVKIGEIRNVMNGASPKADRYQSIEERESDRYFIFSEELKLIASAKRDHQNKNVPLKIDAVFK